MHEVATLLKMYFRELPEPVVPTAFYHPMLEASVKASRFWCHAVALFGKHCTTLFEKYKIPVSAIDR